MSSTNWRGEIYLCDPHKELCIPDFPEKGTICHSCLFACDDYNDQSLFRNKKLFVATWDKKFPNLFAKEWIIISDIRQIIYYYFVTPPISWFWCH